MTTYYVYQYATGDDDGSSWTNAYPTIQAALSVATSGDEIWVKEGSYYTDGSGLVIPEGVSLYGGFSRQLSGTDGTVESRTSGVYSRVRGQGNYPGIIVSANTVTVDGMDCTDCTDDDGAGICIEADGSDKYYGAELLTDGDMETSGTAAWNSGGGGSLAKDTSTVYEGSQSLRVENDGGYAYQIVTSAGVTYRATGAAIGDDATPLLKSGTTTVWTHPTVIEWEEFDVEFSASTNYLALYTSGGEQEHTYWDDVSLRRVYTGYIGDITINNCRIRYCESTDDGAGIYVHNAINVTISNCEIRNNTAAGDGGGICVSSGTYTSISIEDCYIHDNTADNGGALRISSAVNVENTIIDSNTADNISGIYSDGTHQITNCVLSNGVGPNGALFLYGGTVTITNCTIADNANYGVNVHATGTMTIVNSILWNNGTEVNGSPTVSYSNVEGGAGGTGNVNDDPLFVGTGKHAYALSAISDSIDSANSGATYYQSTDIRGSSRYDHPDVTNTGSGTPAYADMGAYEFQGTPLHTMPMQLYFLDQSASSSYQYYMYAILRIPIMPTQFGGNNERPLKHEIQSEVESDDSDSALVEEVMIGTHLAAYRQVSAAYTPPTRAIDYQTDFRKDGDSTTAVEQQYPEPQSMSVIPTVGGDYWYVIAEMRWTPDYDTGSHIRIYNVDFEQIHADDYEYGDIDAGLRPGATWMGPDVPVSAAHLHALQDALLKILYQARTALSVPVFGQFSIPVV